MTIEAIPLLRIVITTLHLEADQTLDLLQDLEEEDNQFTTAVGNYISIDTAQINKAT